MEQRSDTAQLLELMNAPAFSVKDGVIDICNREAQSRSIPQGTPVKDLISIGVEEYEAMLDGCLYLTLTVGSMTYGASVNKMSGFDIFLLESHDDQPELAALDLASRELREPVGELMIHMNRLSPDLCANDPGFASSINHSLYKLLRILNNMSNAHSFKSPSLYHMTEQRIGALLNEVFTQELAPLLEYRGITLEYSDQSEGISTLLDEYKLKQAAYALISNAAGFTPKGGLIRVTLKCTGRRFHLTVIDNGSGIPDSVLGTIFTRYQRGNTSEDHRFGIGLGLVLVRNVAAIHGGTALVERPPEGGTRVTMTFPIRHDRNLSFRTKEATFIDDPTGNALVSLSHILPDELYLPDTTN